MNPFRFLVNHNKQDSFVNSLRKKRFDLLKKDIDALIAAKGSVRILDIGGEKAYWDHIGWNNVHADICLLNLHPPDADPGPGFRYIQGNALQLPFEKNEFDLVFSNSVIEHVGSWKNQQRFADEVRRVSDKYIIQTPSFWFPLEPHSLIPFFQFIPHRLRAFLIMNFNINYFPKASTYQEALRVSHSTRMLTRHQFARLFPDATLQTERLFGLSKSYTAIRL
jgi:hypothetical protein